MDGMGGRIEVREAAARSAQGSQNREAARAHMTSVLFEPSDVTPLTLVLLADERYAMPLATTLSSIARSNRRHWPIQVHVLQDGMSDRSRQRVLDSVPSQSIAILWHGVNLSSFASLSTLPHISRMTYARFLIDQCLPQALRRVLYLDTDILVLADLEQLWRADLRGAIIGAVPDRYIDAMLNGHSGVRREDVPRVRAYLNAGVMVIDLARWRKACVSERSLEYLCRHPTTPYADQDALNVACDGEWTPVDERYNLQSHWEIDLARTESIARPAVVHFVTSQKPWKARAVSINAAFYDAFRDQTAFRRGRVERLHDWTLTQWQRTKDLCARWSRRRP